MPWLAQERILTQQCVAGDVPVLGCCLGGQILARALGGTVREHAQGEYGWLDISPVGEGVRDPLFSLAGAADPVYLWHLDEFTLPPGSVHLATSAADRGPGVPPRPLLGPAVPSRVRPAAVRRLAHGVPRCLHRGRPRPRADAADGGRPGARSGAVRGAAAGRVRVRRAHVAPACARYRGYVPTHLGAARRALARARPDRGPAGRARRAHVPDRAPRGRRARSGRRGPARARDGVAAQGRRLLVVGRTYVPPVRHRRHHAEGQRQAGRLAAAGRRRPLYRPPRRGRLPAGSRQANDRRAARAVGRGLRDRRGAVRPRRLHRACARLPRRRGRSGLPAGRALERQGQPAAPDRRRDRAAGAHRRPRPVGRRLQRRPRPRRRARDGARAQRPLVRAAGGGGVSADRRRRPPVGRPAARRPGRAGARPRPAGARPRRRRGRARPGLRGVRRRHRREVAVHGAPLARRGGVRAADRPDAGAASATSCATSAAPACCTTSASSACRTRSSTSRRS